MSASQGTRDMARRRRNAIPKGRDDDIRLMAALITSGVVSIVILAAMIISPPVKVGPDEGSFAPDFIAYGYENGQWSQTRLSENYDNRMVLVTFLDTDCPHCWDEAGELSILHNEYEADVQFITIVSELKISGHESSRDEIAAFHDKTNYDGCYSGNRNCADRPGNAHQWMYIDDISTSIAGDWKVPGTPFNLILDSNGEVIWNQQQSGADLNENVEDALARLTGVN